ncbi:MAG: hypothetical protein P8J20_06170 [Novosphingobium sp.]|nr:hypothetical protein [Novosphingobium sp.]
MKFKRREFMLASGALAAGGASIPGSGLAATGRAAEDGYFFSAANPIANRDQQHLEALAVELFARPDVIAARKRTRAEFARVTSHTVSPEVWAMLDDWVASYCFRSIQMAVNSDADHPRVMRVYNPAGKWLGNDVPESRWGMENPNNCYRIIPMAQGGRYVVRGQVQDNPPSHSSYVLVADTNSSVTEGLLEFNDLDVGADGTFAITLDETPAGDRKNHIQLTPFARYLFNRDTMGDWMQTPHALRVERLNPPTRAPLTMDELADRASRVMHDGVAQMYYWQRSTVNQPAATFRQPQLTGPAGGLLTQMSSSGWVKLADDEALVVTCDPVEADYFSAVLYDMWGRSLEYRDHFTSLNNAQMAPDDDGRFTFVFASGDPGVHNWLETMGQHELLVTFRWQGISPATVRSPAITSRRVKLADLEAALPAGVRKVSAKPRAKLLATRQRTYDRRFIEV